MKLTDEELPADRDVADRMRLAEMVETKEHNAMRQRVEGWGKVAALSITIGTMIGGIMTSLGMRMIGPPADIAAARTDALRNDSLIITRVNQAFSEIDRLKVTAESNKERIANMEGDLSIVTYVVCVNLRRSDPNAVPPQCNTAIRQGAGGR